jgi:hypothetical protein
LPPKKQVTLIQLIASIAILALPLALYSTPLREESDWLSSGILVALISLSIEMEAFLWLVLTPTLGWCLARRRGVRSTQSRSVDAEGGDLRDRVLLLAGPFLALLIPLVGWGTGYRLYGFDLLKAIIILLLLPCLILVMIPLALSSAIACFVKRSKSFVRAVATVALLVLAIPCLLSFDPAFNAALRLLEENIGVSRLARDCVDVLASRGGPGTFERGRDPKVEDAELRSTVIRRLRPRYVLAQVNSLRIELHGGFDHYGYELTKDEPNGRWVLRWYTEGGGGDRVLLAWPFGRTP